MKKIMIAAMVCISLVSNGVSAAEYSVADGTETVTVTEKLTPGASGLLIVVKADESIENNAETYAAEHCIADENGLAKWSFDMPVVRNSQDTDGKYDLYIKPENGAVKKDVMYFADSDLRISVRDKLRLVDAAEDLEAILSNEGDVIALGSQGFCVDTYKSLVQYKSAISALVYNEVKDFSAVEIDDVAKKLNNSVALIGIKNDSENTEGYLKITDMTFEGRDFGSISDNALLVWLTRLMKTNTGETILEMNTRYNVCNMLYAINNASVSDIGSVLNKYAEGLGIKNSSEYIQYSKLASKAIADENMVNELRKAPAESEEALKSIILKSIPAVQTYPQGGSGAGGGSYGGSSLGGSVISSIPVETRTDSFYDLNEAAWAAEAITEMAAAKIVSGDGTGYFNPNDIMTREQFITMLVLALDGLDENAECTFNDTDEGKWHYRYIASAYNKGIVQGITESSFGTGTYLTRQDMAVLCYRAANKLKPVREKITFSDDESIADYAKAAVYELYEAGAISGMGENQFCPEGTATKAQGAMIIYNLFFAKQ